MGVAAGAAFGVQLGNKNTKEQYRWLVFGILISWLIFLFYQLMEVWLQFGEPFNF